MTPQVHDKLKSILARYDELARLVSEPAIQANPQTYRSHTKEIAEIEPLVEGYRRYTQLADELAQARDVASDPAMKEMAEEEIGRLEHQITGLEEELKVMLVPKDPNDDRNVLLEIRAGTGVDEASLFAGDLFRMYSRYADRRGWKVDVMSMSETGVGGLKEVIASM